MNNEDKINKMKSINEHSPWTDITEGGNVIGNGNSDFFNTGEWRTRAPIWNQDNCKQCLMCFPVCPDSSVIITNGKRGEFDMFHCKGCGICAKICPFGAISMTHEGAEEHNE